MSGGSQRPGAVCSAAGGWMRGRAVGLGAQAGEPREFNSWKLFTLVASSSGRRRPSTARHAATGNHSSSGPVGQGEADAESVATLVNGCAVAACLAVA